MSFRSNFRDKQEWLESTGGCINLSTCSDLAAKHYDACLTQLCGWYEDETLGGLEGSMAAMLAADGEFVLGRALELQLSLMGGLTAPRLDKQLASKMDAFNKLVANKQASNALSELEQLHAQVVNHWANGQLKQSVQVLEDIVTLYPEDVSAVKMAQDTYFYLGQSLAMRNSVASCIRRLTRADGQGRTGTANPLQGYVHGMFSFALEESMMFPQAEREALKALDLIPRDTWAIHNYAHCLEMQAKPAEGLKWMLDRKVDWEPCQTLSCHQYWHTALFQINNGQFEQAVGLLDEDVLGRCVDSCSTLDVHDAASMVYRMELVDLFNKLTGAISSGEQGERTASSQRSAIKDNSDRWTSVYEICKPHKRDHLIGFNDAHFMMSFLGANDLVAARELIDSIDEVPTLNEGRTVVKPLLEAMFAFKSGDFDTCVELLNPIRFEIVKIGGSHAQRDVFEQLLLVAGIKSEKRANQLMAERMLNEREAFHGGRRLPQTELLATA